MTAYAMSLLMDRRFIIDVSTPCRLEEAFEPNEVNWLFSSLPSNYSHLSKYRYYIEYSIFYVNILSKKNFLKFKQNTDVILVRTGYDLLRNLANNPKHHAKIKSLGYSIDTFNIESLFYVWFRKLFKFKPYLESTFQEMLKKLKPNSKTKLICAQIRIGGNKDKQFVYPSQVELFWKKIQDKFITNKHDYRIFITSDKSFVIDEALKEFGRDKLIGFKNRSFHISNKYMKLPPLKQNECKKISELFLDFHVLGKCDMGLISHSGFGIVGILNRENKSDSDNFYIFTNPVEKKKDYWSMENLAFHQFNTNLI